MLQYFQYLFVEPFPSTKSPDIQIITMKQFVTCLAMLIASPAALALAQAGPALGSDFIFFRNGTNTSIPDVGGTEEADQNDPNEISIRYDYSDWSYQFFGWDPGVGKDLTGNLTSNDILHLKLRVHQDNASKDNTFIMFEDKTNGQPDDLPMRLVWRVPASMKDGNWHTLDIPLPPEKCADLASARGTLGLADNWWYGGSWSNATQRVGDYDDECGNTTNNPQYWKEFEWTNVKSLGAFFDHNTGGNSIWFDDVYIGSAGLDLTIADAPPAAMSGVMVETLPEGNKISWTHDASFGGYRVYGSSNAFTDAGADGVFEMGTIPGDAMDFSLTHYLQYVHPTVAPGATNAFMYSPYYGVASLSQFGVENKDVTNSMANPTNADLSLAPVILELTDAEAGMLLTDFASGNASGSGFHSDWLPFMLNQSHYKLADVQTPPDNDDDLSGTFWLGYSQLNELWLYAEVRDDQIDLPSSGTGDPWNYDTIEIGWANYDVTDDGGDVIFGTPHQDFSRGMYADYQFRIAGRDGGSAAFWEVGNPGVGEVGGAVYNAWMDNSGNQIGYKILGVLPLDGIQETSTGDAVLSPPGAGDPIRYMAIDIVLNDRDSGTREHQIQTSRKYNAGGQWWNTPAEWETVAMSPRDQHPIATQTEFPEDFVLNQNYPNPFNPTTNIGFTLGSAERVTLTVHDVLGRKVATLLQGQQLVAGSHSVPFRAEGLASGIYIYQIRAGDAFMQTKRMILVK